MNLSDIRTAIYRDVGESPTNNDRVTSAALLEVINQGYERVAAEAGCFVRDYTVAAVDSQEAYDMPDDMFAVRCVRYGTQITPLIRTTIGELDWKSPSWRDAADGTPAYVYLLDTQRFGVYPPPDIGTAANLVVEGHVIPVATPDGTAGTSVGAVGAVEAAPADTKFNISVDGSPVALCTMVWAGEVTGATIAANIQATIRLLTGAWFDNVTVTFSGTGGTAKYTVTSGTNGPFSRVVITSGDTAAEPGSLNVADDLKLGLANVGAVETRGTGGIIKLAYDHDIPQIPANFHLILVHYSVWTLASRFLLDGEAAASKAQAARAEYDALMASFMNYYTSAVGRRPSPLAK